MNRLKKLLIGALGAVSVGAPVATAALPEAAAHAVAYDDWSGNFGTLRLPTYRAAGAGGFTGVSGFITNDSFVAGRAPYWAGRQTVVAEGELQIWDPYTSQWKLYGGPAYQLRWGGTIAAGAQQATFGVLQNGYGQSTSVSSFYPRDLRGYWRINWTVVWGQGSTRIGYLQMHTDTNGEITCATSYRLYCQQGPGWVKLWT